VPSHEAPNSVAEVALRNWNILGAVARKTAVTNLTQSSDMSIDPSKYEYVVNVDTKRGPVV
jgi:hypothetical protein